MFYKVFFLPSFFLPASLRQENWGQEKSLAEGKET
jgi:hypothetical protein